MKILAFAATAFLASTALASAHVNHVDRDFRGTAPVVTDEWRNVSNAREWSPSSWAATPNNNGCATLTGGPSGGPNQS